MKKLTALVLTIICVLGLCACNSSTSSDQGAAPEAYSFEAQYIRTNGYSYSEDRSYPYHVVIDSKDELEAYYEANKELFDLERKDSDTKIGFLDACDKYDDTYFERQNLVLIILEEGSGSIRHEITDVRRRWDENGASLGWNIYISKALLPKFLQKIWRHGICFLKSKWEMSLRTKTMCGSTINSAAQVIIRRSLKNRECAQ